MSEVRIDSSVIALAEQRLGSLRSALSGSLPSYGDLVAVVDAVAQLESGYERARLNILALHRRGLATPADYREFEVMRSNTGTLQAKLVRFVRAVFAGHPDALARIPNASRPPPLGAPASSGVYGSGGTDLSGRRLGTPAAAAIPAWMVGTIILTSLAALIAAIFVAGVVIVAVVVAGSLAADTIRDIWLGLEQLEAHNRAREERLQVFERCRAEGNSVEVCRLSASELVTDPPIIIPNDTPGWLTWAIAGVALLVVAGGGIWLVGRLMGSGSGREVDYDLSGLSGQPRYRPISRNTLAHGEDRFDLLVKDR